MIDVNNLCVRSLQGLPLLFLDKRDDFRDKYEDFTTLASRKC